MGKKFDFECIYYTNQLIQQLDEEGVYVRDSILPEKLRYIVLQLVQSNYEATGFLGLYQEQMIGAMERAQEMTYKATMDEMLKEGLVEVVGIDKEGEYALRITEAGKKADDESKELLRLAEKVREEFDKHRPPTPEV